MSFEEAAATFAVRLKHFLHLLILYCMNFMKEVGRKSSDTDTSPRSHPRHFERNRTAQKDTIIDIISDSQLDSRMYSAISIYRKPPGRVAQSEGHLTRKSGVLGSIPGLATYLRFSFRFFKKGSYHLLAKVCARSTG